MSYYDDNEDFILNSHFLWKKNFLYQDFRPKISKIRIIVNQDGIKRVLAETSKVNEDNRFITIDEKIYFRVKGKIIKKFPEWELVSWNHRHQAKFFSSIEEARTIAEKVLGDRQFIIDEFETVLKI